MRGVTGRRQSRLAECPAKRAKGDAIVPDGWKEKEYRRVGNGPETLLEWS